MRITTTVSVLIGLLLVEARIAGSGTAFCPERCICRKADGANGQLSDSLDQTTDTENGWAVKCGGTDTNKIISIKEISFGDIEDQITHL